VRESLNHAALHQGVEVKVEYLSSADLEKGKGFDILEKADGIIVPGGFGSRGVEGKIIAAHYARKNKVPYLGLCLGMQVMVIDFAREVFQDEKANSSEFDKLTSYPVIDLMPDQQNLKNMGGTMRLGLYPCKLAPGSLSQALYNTEEISERHRHRYELNNEYRDELEANGLRMAGVYPEGDLVEITEVIDHPYMVGCQFHPEFLSRPNRPHPLFSGFIKAIRERVGL